jgi:FkbM family methyltransferase
MTIKKRHRMVLQIIKSLARKSLNAFGLEVQRSRGSFIGALQQIRDLGFSPALVIDVGAGVGMFTLQCHRIFPDSRYLLVEPLQENSPSLEQATKRIKNAEYVLAVAHSEPGEVTLNVHSDFAGSSLYLENEPDLDGTPRNVQAVTLDNLCKERCVSGPYLIKIDVQGAELDVISGAMEIIDQIEYIILEVSLYQFVKKGPQIYDVITFMRSHGFVVYDIFGLNYRRLDDALAQVDMAFIKDNSPFRKHHIYADTKQREKLTEKMLKARL